MQKEMKKKKEKAVKKLKEKIEKILEHNRVIIINDYDIDSCASASILWRILKKEGVNVKHLTLSKGVEEKIIQELKNENPDKVVVVDYVPSKELTNELENFSTTILDHHLHEKHLNKLDYYTTADYNVKYAALSYWLYLAAKELKVKNIEWLAELGCFWDKCMENTEFNEENVYEKKMEKMFPFNLMVSYSQTKGASRMVEIFNGSSSFEEANEKVKSTRQWQKAKQTFERELHYIELSKKEYPKIKLNIYRVTTKFKHMRVFVDYITYLNKGTQIFVLNEITRFKFSFRTSLDINLAKIIKKIAKENPDFNGGGHPKACGALLKNRNIDELLEKFIEEYKKVI